MLVGKLQEIGNILSVNRYENLLKVQSFFSDSNIEIGSIALAGISFTITHFSKNNPSETLAEIMNIPHTYKHVILKYYSAGMWIEVEFDQSIKAIASLLKSMLPNYIQARK
ncbi:hypothetical protein [Fluviispira sanaruensis]|uniref:Lumazine-binding domain-containing protein n=1 Tax=Fluviispira sanaruensis TaxID=2493639 RepID=A0A4P2VLF2_FLUSA|nr:hypothetical protein [Fluviispira sanaruensis]BBH52209.1 hypothetical protein JCM31447_06490 [Fluviispira sanaruensis]